MSYGFINDLVSLAHIVFDISAKAGCLSFAYNMFGRHVNNLTLFSEGTNQARTSLWTKNGNQGSDWLTAKVNIPEAQGLKVYSNFIIVGI